MHPRRVPALGGSHLIDQKVPRRCGLSPAAWGRGSLAMECCFVGSAADVSRKGRSYGDRYALCR